MKILIVDDEEIALTSLQRLLKRRDLRDVTICNGGARAIELIKENDFDIILLDLLMPEVDGFSVLKETRPFNTDSEYIVLTAVDDLETAIHCIRLGAYDYLLKPVDHERLLLAIHRAFERKGLRCGFTSSKTSNQEDDIPESFTSIITRNLRMKELFRYAHIMARSGNPILITGESGTGKELFANAIHQAGLAPDGPFVPVNVSSIPETLFEGQFFGYTKGAFTGADIDYPGFFEQADGGTLFLDEIGELPINLQAKFLRLLEEKQVTPLGKTKPVFFDVRIISATNIDLDKACQEGAFRLDLLYRLKSAHIHIPPLRERMDDLPYLIDHFLKLACRKHHRNIANFDPQSLKILHEKSYPGNVRELATVVENAVLMADSDRIFPVHIGEQLSQPSISSRTLCTYKDNNLIHLAYVLNHTHGDLKETAGILGVTLRHIQRQVVELKSIPQYAALLDDK